MMIYHILYQVPLLNEFEGRYSNFNLFVSLPPCMPTCTWNHVQSKGNFETQNAYEISFHLHW